MRTLRTAAWLLLAALLCARDAMAFHKPGWDTGHQTMDSTPGIENTDPGSSAPRSCGSPVEVRSGNFIHALPQLSLSGLGPGINLTLIYNSHDLRSGTFGVGWTHAYEERVVVTTDGAQVFAICCQGRGKRDRMIRGADGRRYTSLPPNILTMSRNADETHTIRDKHGNVKEFDADGKLVRIVDRNGNAVVLGYDGTGFLTTLTDAAGRVTRFTKGPNGRVAMITDPANRTFQYSYDAGGHLTGITDPLVQSWKLEYNAAGLLSRIVDPKGHTDAAIEYDSARRVSRLVEGAETWQYSYASDHTSKSDSSNNTWVFQYNAAGSITRAADPLGKSVAYTYDAGFNTTSITNEGGRQTRYTYDASDNVLTMVNPYGDTYTVAYEPAFNLPVSLTDPVGNVTLLQYDPRGNLTAVTDPSGAVSRFEYDAKGQLTQTTDALGGVSKLAYDTYGNVTSFTAPGKAAELTTYDILGRLLTSTDARGSQYQFAYDANGQLTSSTNPASGVTTRQYDAAGNLTSLTLPNGSVYKFEFDQYDRLAIVTNPVSQSASYTYDSHDNVTTSSDSAARTIRYTYDPLDRLLTKVTPDDTVRYTYDTIGNLLSVANGTSTVTFLYDAANRVVQANSTPQNVNINYAYDAASRLVSLTDPSGKLTYDYNRRSLVTSITDFDGFTTTFNYDGNRRRTRMDRTGGFATTYAYDAANRLLTLAHASPAGALNFAYAYDQADNRLTMTDKAGVHTYGYNRRDYLTAATHPTADNPAELYTYDPAGNRLTSHLSATYTHNAANRLVSDATFDYTYDGDGNLVSRRNKGNNNLRSFAYDAENRLTKITFPDGSIATYRYDGLGRRYEKNVAGQVTRYVYTGSTILRELDGANATVARYTPGVDWDETLAVRRGGTTSVFEADALGSIVRTTAGSTANSTYQYDAFGRITAQTGTAPSPFAFQGRELDLESRLYYFRARYYDPVVGRFVTEDPAGFVDGLNLYSFVNNNPLKYVDPAGLAGRCVPPAPPGEDVDAAVKTAVAHKTPPETALLMPDFYAANKFGELLWFGHQFWPGGPWDLKTQGKGDQYAYAGNFWYGATGSALGLPPGVLLRTAGAMHSIVQLLNGQWPSGAGNWWGDAPYGDQPAEQTVIQNGIDYFGNGCSCPLPR